MPQTPVTQTRASIESRLADARASRSIRRIKELEHLLFISRAQNGKPIRDIRAMVSRSFRRISDIIDGPANTPEKQQAIEAVFRELNRSASGGVRDILEEIASDIIESSRLNIESIATPEITRALTGLPIDNRGFVIPQPGEVERIEDESLSLTEILLIASPLLVLPGIIYLQEKAPPIKQLVDEDDEALIAELVDFVDPAVSGSITQKLEQIAIDAGVQSTSVIIDLDQDGPPAAKENARQTLERYGNSIANEIRHETLKQKGRQADRVFEVATADVLVGYTLHSRFLDTTDPVHAGNDGNRYFQDNREGSTAPWSERLVPPYRKNCVCFSIEIWENPLGDVFSTEFDAIPRLSGSRVIRVADIGSRVFSLDDNGFITITGSDVGRLIRSREDWEVITPRDVGSFARWYDQQLPGIRRTLVGDQRFEAAFARRGGLPQYGDFVDGRGRFASARTILQETEGERLVRLERSRTTIEAQERFHVEAWEAGEDRWALNPREERRYKSRLEVFLNRVL